MRIQLLFSLFVLFISQLLSASSVSDSLKKELKQNPKQGAHLHFLIARDFYYKTYGFAANQDSVLRYLTIATKLAINENIDSTLAKCYMYKGKVLSREGLFAESNEIIKKAKAIFSTLGDSIAVSKMDYIIAYNYLDLSMYTEGIEHLEKAINRSSNSKDSVFVASMNIAMGSFLTAMRQFTESRPYTKKAIYLLGDKNQRGLGGAYHNLARSFSFNEMYDSSYYYYQKALESWKSIDYKRGEGLLYNNLSEFFTQQEKYDRSIDYLLKGEILLLEVNDKRSLKDTYLKIAENYLLLKNPIQAKKYVQKAETLGIEHKPFSFFHELDRLKAKMYAQLKDYEKAYYHQVEFLKRADTLVKQEAEERVLESNRRLEFLEKSKNIELKNSSIKVLQQEKKLLLNQQRIYLISGFGILLIIALCIFYFIKRKKYRSEILEADLSKSKALNLQLEREIEFRKKKLSSFALQMADKNQKLDQVKSELQKLSESITDSTIADSISGIEQRINKAINTEDNWQEFRLFFEEVHTNFFTELQAKHTNLTNRELRLAALLRLNLTTKEIANLLNLPVKTIEVSRYRFRKKLNLNSDDNLVDYMMKFT